MGKGGGILSVYSRGGGGGREGGICCCMRNLLESSHIIKKFSLLQILLSIVDGRSWC